MPNAERAAMAYLGRHRDAGRGPADQRGVAAARAFARRSPPRPTSSRLERRLGSSALNAHHQRWRIARGDRRLADVLLVSAQRHHRGKPGAGLGAAGRRNHPEHHRFRRRQHDCDGDRAHRPAADGAAERDAQDAAGRAGAGDRGQPLRADAGAARPPSRCAGGTAGHSDRAVRVCCWARSTPVTG